MRTKNLIFSVIALLFFSSMALAQVRGTVVDEFGPIPGVNISVVGSEESTVTDDDGNFTIMANVGDQLTIVNPLTLAEKNVAVTKLDLGKLSIKDAAVTLDEVVVAGVMGIERKEDAVTAAYEVVGSEELNQASSPNAVQALQGKVSGLQINTTSAGVDADNRVVLRNPRSITGNNQALVVIDGAVSSLSTLSQIPPESVANITVLKGLQGAALYGSDGVNGVIIVNTIKGSKSGDLEISIKSSTDMSTIAYLPQRQLRYGQGWDGEFYADENGSWGPEFNGSLQPVGLPREDGTYVWSPYSPIKDNYRQFFKKGFLFQNTVSVSGGDLEEGYVLASVTNQFNNFVVEGDQLKRNSFLVKGGKRMGNWTLESNVNYITQKVEQASANLNGGFYRSLLQTPANVPVSQFENAGNDSHWTKYFLNPYWVRDNQREDLSQERLTGTINVGYKINDHINISYLANVRNTATHNLYFQNKYVDTHSNRSQDDAFLNSNSLYRKYYGDLLVNFDYMLTDDISLQASLGNNVQGETFSISEAGGTGFENPKVYNYSNVLSPYTSGSSTIAGRRLANYHTSQNKYGFFANVDLAYKDFLYLNVTGRNDWSSVFLKENNSYFYPGAGVSFVATKAFPGMRTDNGISHLKFSFNYTKVGNESAVGAYEINDLASLGIGYPMDGLNSYTRSLFKTNRYIKPEFVTNVEANMNLNLFKDRFGVDVSVYQSTTTDLITNYSPSRASGFYRIKDNIGDLEGKGYELDLRIIPIRTANFEWNVNASLSQTKTIITKLATDNPGEEVSLRSPNSAVGIFAQVGQEFPLIKGSAYKRDDWGRVIVDKNGMPSTIDGVILGKASPDYIIGLNTSVKIYGIRLSATMDYRGGKDYKFYSNVKSDLAYSGQLIESAENRSGFVMPNSSYDYNGDGAIQENEVNTNVVTGANISSFIGYYNVYYATGENVVIDASAFKLREIAASYTVDSRGILKNTGISEITLGVNARNPLTILSKQNRGYNDPETSEGTGNASGLAFTNRYPVQTYYGGSINIKF